MAQAGASAVRLSRQSRHWVRPGRSRLRSPPNGGLAPAAASHTHASHPPRTGDRGIPAEAGHPGSNGRARPARCRGRHGRHGHPDAGPRIDNRGRDLGRDLGPAARNSKPRPGIRRQAMRPAAICFLRFLSLSTPFDWPPRPWHLNGRSNKDKAPRRQQSTRMTCRDKQARNVDARLKDSGWDSICGRHGVGKRRIGRPPGCWPRPVRTERDSRELAGREISAGLVKTGASGRQSGDAADITPEAVLRDTPMPSPGAGGKPPSPHRTA